MLGISYALLLIVSAVESLSFVGATLGVLECLCFLFPVSGAAIAIGARTDKNAGWG